MARGFGSTDGTGTTDVVTTGNITATTQISFWMWLRVNGQGGGLGLNVGGRFFSWGSTSYSYMEIRNTPLPSQFQYNQSFSSNNGQWATTANLATAGTWHSLGLSYDSSSISNVPIFYVDGTKVTGGNVTTENAPTGSATLVSAVGASIGNAGTVRVVDGRMADFAIWNLLLSDAEFAALAQGARPPTIRPGSFIGYWPLDGLRSPEADLSGKNNSGVVTATALAFGPPFMQLTPLWPQNIFAAAAAPPTGKHHPNMPMMGM